MSGEAQRLAEEQERSEEAQAQQEEREAFDKAVTDDPDLQGEGPALAAVPDEPPAGETEPPAGEAKPPGDEPPAGEEEQPQPTGMEWLENLPEEDQPAVKAMLARMAEDNARLQQRVSSHLGQLQPAQRMIAQLQRKVTQLEQMAAPKPGETPAQVKEKVDAMNAWIDKEYEDYPEEAAKLKAQLTELSDGLAQSLESVQAPAGQPPATQPHVPERNNEVAHLTAAYPDWGERRYSPAFDQWIRQQPPDVVQLLNSPYASDNVALLDRFSADNPEWVSPQTPDEFVSYSQAQYNPLFRGWAEAEGFNPDTPVNMLTPNQQGLILQQFKADLGEAYKEQQEGDGDPEPAGVTQRVTRRRQAQLRDRDLGSRRSGIRAGDRIDLDTEEGQRALYNQYVEQDPDLKL
jgi:hypothetical protein